MPKPLLPLGGKRLIQWAMESVTLLKGSYHYLPTLDLSLHREFGGLLPPGCFHIILDPTKGPLQTVLQAEGCLATEEELLICDCDSFMDAKELAGAVEVFRVTGAQGGVTVRRTTDPMCSYAAVDTEWWVSHTREQDPFTPWSTTGPYWFRSAQAFLKAARKAAAAQHASIAPVYNYLDGRTKAVPVASFHHLGTPEAYEAARKLVWEQQTVGG